MKALVKDKESAMPSFCKIQRLFKAGGCLYSPTFREQVFSEAQFPPYPVLGNSLFLLTQEYLNLPHVLPLTPDVCLAIL